MMKKILVIAFLTALGFGQTGGVTPARASEGEIPKQSWSFDGVFGTFDRAATQRGYQVYKEVCSACHSLRLVSFRNLEAIGFNEEEIKALAAEATITDGPDDEGEMFEREGFPSDRFPSPFPNAKAAAAANNGTVPPDFSLIAKARKGGPDYIYAVLTGYHDAPEDFEVPEESNYNTAFPGNKIAMAPPLAEDAVEYADGTAATVEQMSHDVSTFLMWTAEPNLEDRKRMGIKVLLFLLVLTGLLYAVKKKVWADLH